MKVLQREGKGREGEGREEKESKKERKKEKQKITDATETGITESKRWKKHGGYLTQINAKPVSIAAIS